MWEGSVWPRMQYPSCYRLQDISPLLLFCDLCNDEPSHPTRCSFIARLPVSHTQRIASSLPRHPLKYNPVSLRPHFHVVARPETCMFHTQTLLFQHETCEVSRVSPVFLARVLAAQIFVMYLELPSVRPRPVTLFLSSPRPSVGRRPNGFLGLALNDRT